MKFQIFRFHSTLQVLETWRLGIKIFKFNIITYLHKFSNKIILYLEGCLISATPSVNLAHFLSTLPSSGSKTSETFCLYSVLHNSFFIQNLKVPKREIFDRSDFPDFYTIKSPLRVGDFGVKIKKNLKKYLGVHLGVKSSLCVCSVYF